MHCLCLLATLLAAPALGCSLRLLHCARPLAIFLALVASSLLCARRPQPALRSSSQPALRSLQPASRARRGLAHLACARRSSWIACVALVACTACARHTRRSLLPCARRSLLALVTVCAPCARRAACRAPRNLRSSQLALRSSQLARARSSQPALLALVAQLACARRSLRSSRSSRSSQSSNLQLASSSRSLVSSPVTQLLVKHTDTHTPYHTPHTDRHIPCHTHTHTHTHTPFC
jgi:hypothetical protein